MSPSQRIIFSQIGNHYTKGLDEIIGKMPSIPEIGDLVKEVSNYVYTICYPSAPMKALTELEEIAQTAITNYINNLILGNDHSYDVTQKQYIQHLIGKSLLLKADDNSIIDRICYVENGISDSKLPDYKQQPLLLATIIGTYANDYWKTQVSSSQSPWAHFFSNVTKERFDYLQNIDIAAMNGSLVGYIINSKELGAPVTRVEPNLVCALVGALTITIGKIVFNWIPKITKKLSLNIQTVSELGNQEGYRFGVVQSITGFCCSDPFSTCATCPNISMCDCKYSGDTAENQFNTCQKCSLTTNPLAANCNTVVAGICVNTADAQACDSGTRGAITCQTIGYNWDQCSYTAEQGSCHNTFLSACTQITPECM